MKAKVLSHPLRLLGLVVAGAVACGGGEKVTGPPAVATVEVSPSADTLTALGQTRQFTAVAKDASGTAIAGKTFTWQSSTPSVATVSGAGLATAVANGQATLTATVEGKSGQALLTVAQAVASVAVTPGTAALSALGATQQFSAVATDANGNVVANVPFLWLSSNQNVATIDANGLATSTGPGAATITAAGHGIPGTAALTVTETATQVAFTVQPTNATAGQALSPAVQVEIRDAGGVRVASARDAVTLAIGTNPGGGTLAGTKTVNAVSGVATFSGLAIDKTGAGYTLVASSGALSGATSSSFTISAAAAAKLAFTGQPSNATAGVAISPAVAVAIQDAFGNRVTTATDPVTAFLGANPGGGTLSGTTTVNAVAGVASFSTLSIDKAGTGYTLVATAGALASASSTGFNVSAAAAARLAFTVQPTTTDLSQTITPAVRVAIQDAFANTVTTAMNPVTVALGANPGGGTLSGTTAVNAVSGFATFANLRIDRPGFGYTLAATSGTFAGATSAPFDIRHILFATVSAGASHACGVTTFFGVAYCWGYNASGQLGDGTTTQRTSPVAVLGGLTFARVSAGGSHTCGVTTSGAAYCWGNNSNGQLGDGTTTQRTSPVAVSGGLTFATVSTDTLHTCGVTTGGAAYCWGYNGSGQLGDATTTDRTSPVAVSGGFTFATVSAGGSHTCGVTTGGAAYCWGNNSNGQLGDGTTTQRTSPVAVSGGLTFAAVSAGDSHTCGVGATFTACWGSNGFGQVGDGTTTDRTSPVLVLSTTTFTAAGFGHTCGVTKVAFFVSVSVAYCWGLNASGQLGDGTTTNRTSPMPILGGLTFAAGTAGFGHTCGVTTGGAAYCWGNNSNGQLGDGTTTQRTSPVPMVQ